MSDFLHFSTIVVFFFLCMCACCVFRPSEIKCAVQRNTNKITDNIFHVFF